MTTDDHDSGLTPEQEREIRRLLADARHAEPMPDDVVARLDRVLVELARGEPGEAPVIALASRRRRVTSLLVAAAAVVALGIGLGQVIGTRDQSADPSASDAQSLQDAPEVSSPKGSDRSTSAEAATPSYARHKPVRIRPERFSADVVRTQGLVIATSGELSSEYNAGDNAAGAYFDCSPAEWGAGIFVPVMYGGDAGVLVFRRAMGDTQVVDLFQCGSSDALRSITLPAP